MNGNTDSDRKPLSRWWRWLLVLPFIALMWVPSYNSIEPGDETVPEDYHLEPAPATESPTPISATA